MYIKKAETPFKNYFPHRIIDVNTYLHSKCQKNRFRNCVFKIASFIFLIFYFGQVQAILLSLEPSTQDIGVGDTTTVDLNISGLGNYAPDSLGAFSIDVLFDDSILSFDSVNYGTSLGDPTDFFETDVFTLMGPGFTTVSEISFLFDFELDLLQPSDFTLATFNFSGVGVGQSALDFGFVDLSDAVFPASTLLADTSGSFINVMDTITPPPTTVPAPSTFWLIITGIFVGNCVLRQCIKNS